MFQYDHYPPAEANQVHLTESAWHQFRDIHTDATHEGIRNFGALCAGDLISAFRGVSSRDWPAVSGKVVEFTLAALQEAERRERRKIQESQPDFNIGPIFYGDVERYAAFLGGITAEIAEYRQPWNEYLNNGGAE